MPGPENGKSAQANEEPLFPNRPIRGPLRRFGHFFGFVTMGEINEVAKAMETVSRREDELKQKVDQILQETQKNLRATQENLRAAQEDTHKSTESPLRLLRKLGY